MATSQPETTPPGRIIDVMLDTETLDVSSQPVLLSIGGVARDAGGSEVLLPTEFHYLVNIDSCLKAGLKVSGGTIRWWMQQSDAARQALFAGKSSPLEIALNRLTTWFHAIRGTMTNKDQLQVWSYGAAADIVWLESAYRVIDQRHPWTYKEVRCLRTVVELAKQAGVSIPERPSGMVQHDALEDAKYQMQVLEAVRHG